MSKGHYNVPQGYTLNNVKVEFELRHLFSRHILAAKKRDTLGYPTAFLGISQIT